MVSIKLSNVSKSYGKQKVIDNLSLDINDGEYLTILGPTGAGKTTLLKIICGLVDPDAGEIQIGGRVVNDISPEYRDVAYLPQTYSLFPHMDVWQNVVFSPTAKGVPPSETDIIGKEMLNIVKLWKRPDAYPSELSGGMQQRCALARAMAANAKVLLLDEPLRALDARLRIDLRYELRKLSKDLGITTIHVTHDQEEAMTISDRIAVIRSGKMVQADTPRRLFEEPANPFVADFLGLSNLINGTVSESIGSIANIRDAEGRIFKARTPLPAGAKVSLVIKTEYVKIDTEKADGPNTLAGTIEQYSFLGRFSVLTIKSKSQKIMAKLLSSTAAKYAEGASVRVMLDSEKLLVFPRADGDGGKNGYGGV